MRWRTKARLWAAVYLVAAGLAANLGHGAAANTSDANVEAFANAPFLSNAEAEAHRHLDQFLSRVLLPNGSPLDGAAVRVAVPTTGGRTEMIWVAPSARLSDDAYLGTVADVRGAVEGTAVGKTISFTRQQVRDWSFIGPHAKLYGNFTTRALLPHVEPKDAAKIASALAALPVPSDW